MRRARFPAPGCVPIDKSLRLVFAAAAAAQPKPAAAQPQPAAAEPESAAAAQPEPAAAAEPEPAAAEVLS
jgi:hypothetical protein